MLLSEIFQTSDKHVTFCFGRMNPPTIGHKQMFDTMQRVGGDYKIFLSQTRDKRENPLDYSTKIEFIKLLFPQHTANVVENSGLNTIVKVASFLYDQGYRHATFVAGDDRLGTFKKLLSDYNGVEGKTHGYYKFETFDFVSCGERCPDGDGLEGVSASRAREQASENNLDGFIKTTGAGQYAEALFHAVRAGLGITDESTNEGFMSFLKTEPPPKKKWNPATDSRVVSNYRDDEAWIKLLLDKRRRGIELTDREWNSLEQWKLKKAMVGK